MDIKEYIKKKKNLSFLIIRMKPVGDTILTTPIFYILKKKFPDCKISVIINKRFAELIRNNPYCDEILEYDTRKSLSFLFKILFRSFDISIDFLNNPRTSQITLFTWAKYRIGITKPRNFFYNIKVKVRDVMYTVDCSIKSLAPLGINNPEYKYYYEPSQGSMKFAGSFLEQKGIQNGIVGINISVSSLVKKWKFEKFIELGKKITSSLNMDVLILWGPEDKHRIEGLGKELENTNSIHIIPETSIDQLGAFIKLCSLLVTGDGGPKHMAVAMDIPTLTIFGGINAIFWNPSDTKKFPFITSDIDCYPCNVLHCRYNTLECLQSISVDAVFNIVKGMV